MYLEKILETLHFLTALPPDYTLSISTLNVQNDHRHSWALLSEIKEEYFVNMLTLKIKIIFK